LTARCGRVEVSGSSVHGDRARHLVLATCREPHLDRVAALADVVELERIVGVAAKRHETCRIDRECGIELPALITPQPDQRTHNE